MNNLRCACMFECCFTLHPVCLFDLLRASVVPSGVPRCAAGASCPSTSFISARAFFIVAVSPRRCEVPEAVGLQ